METVVVRTTQKDNDSDRFALLEQVIKEAGFWDILENEFVKSGKTKKDFLVAVKPNLMMYCKKDNMSIITEPALVKHLINKIAEKGFCNIALVESQNTFGNWFENRDVKNVAKQAGYNPNPINYHVVDLTMDVVAHVYKGSLGTYLVGKTWRDADFRISFAKNKTHTFCYYTLTIKNIYGTTPEQNKFREYHANRKIDEVTMEMLKEFPVHFGVIDGIWSADALLDAPNHTKTIIAGANLIAVDWVGGMKMGLDPMKNRFIKLAVEKKYFEKPEIKCIGDDSIYKGWHNVPWGLDYLMYYGEKFYGPTNCLGFISSDMDTNAFPMKNIEETSPWITKVLQSVVIQIVKIIREYNLRLS
jgi:uncharacterized protein (DUF362 family)